jgi:3-oxoacyl-[acyl-carrier protein] reductase
MTNVGTYKTAFVSGASRGIGLACARALAETGVHVVLAARDAAKLEAASREIPNSTWVTIDLSSADSIKEAFAKAGKIDILVNNAAVTKDGLAVRMKKDDWDSVISTNLTGAFLATQQVLQNMMKVRWGRIVNISSVVGESGNPGQANYVASKAGLVGLTKSLAQEMASRNITVNAVAPGFIETDMTAVLPQELKEKMIGHIPLKRFGRAEDVAAAVRFLASEEAGYITGAVLNVNGGMYM